MSYSPVVKTHLVVKALLPLTACLQILSLPRFLLSHFRLPVGTSPFLYVEPSWCWLACLDYLLVSVAVLLWIPGSFSCLLLLGPPIISFGTCRYWPFSWFCPITAHPAVSGPMPRHIVCPWSSGITGLLVALSCQHFRNDLDGEKVGLQIQCTSDLQLRWQWWKVGSWS